MDEQRLKWGVGILGVIVLVLGVWYWSVSRGGMQNNTVPPVDLTYVPPNAVTVRHHVEGEGVHTYFGTVPMRSTCAQVGSGVSTDEGADAVQVTVNVVVLEGDNGNCLDTPEGTVHPFEARFIPQSSKPLQFNKFLINGQPVPFTVLEV